MNIVHIVLIVACFGTFCVAYDDEPSFCKTSNIVQDCSVASSDGCERCIRWDACEESNNFDRFAFDHPEMIEVLGRCYLHNTRIVRVAIPTDGQMPESCDITVYLFEYLQNLISNRERSYGSHCLYQGNDIICRFMVDYPGNYTAVEETIVSAFDEWTNFTTYNQPGCIDDLGLYITSRPVVTHSRVLDADKVNTANECPTFTFWTFVITYSLAIIVGLIVLVMCVKKCKKCFCSSQKLHENLVAQKKLLIEL